LPCAFAANYDLRGAGQTNAGESALVGEALWARAATVARNNPRHITRIERSVSPALEETASPALAALDDQQTLLMDTLPRSQPVLEQLVEPVNPANPRDALGAAVAADTDPALLENVKPRPQWNWNRGRQTIDLSTVLVVVVLIVLVVFRKGILAAVNRLVLSAVVAVGQPGATIISPPRRRRRRKRHNSSRRQRPDVSWYFRTASSSRSSSRRRRRWTSTLHPREYVVTDVVYAAAAAQPVPRYLLTHSAN
jgi:hypothetical protein